MSALLLESPYLMFTVEPTAAQRAEAAALLRTFDAVLGPTSGDGWWAYGLRDPALAAKLPLTTASAGTLVLATLRLGLRIVMLR
jgi:glycosyltransferase A (GT-A) superfamily protein (DUF2064 family)